MLTKVIRVIRVIRALRALIIELFRAKTVGSCNAQYSGLDRRIANSEIISIILSHHRHKLLLHYNFYLNNAIEELS